MRSRRREVHIREMVIRPPTDKTFVEVNLYNRVFSQAQTTVEERHWHWRAYRAEGRSMASCAPDTHGGVTSKCR